ncbi:MAG: head GIN domain-containing protein [Bacteroidota bacterium]
MNNHKFLLALVLLVSMTLTGCFIDVNDDDGLFGCIDADGPITTADLELDDFDGIALAMDAQIEITQGPEQLVTFEGKSDILDELDLDVDNGVWTIRTVDCVRDVDDLTFFITVPDLDKIILSGSGDIVSTNTFVNAGDVELSISGSGEIDVAYEADDIEATISGSGKITIEGLADDLDLSISGSGDYRGFNLFTNSADISIAGSGDAEVQVADRLEVSIAGSGDVFYKGQPELDVTISGSGEVIDAN